MASGQPVGCAARCACTGLVREVMSKMKKARGSAPGPRWGLRPQTPIHGGYNKLDPAGHVSPAGSRATEPLAFLSACLPFCGTGARRRANRQAHPTAHPEGHFVIQPGQATCCARPRHRVEVTPRSPHPEVVADESKRRPPRPKAKIRVTYVPQFIRKQIADPGAGSRSWTRRRPKAGLQPDALPEWTKRIKLTGDLPRARRRRYVRQQQL